MLLSASSCYRVENVRSALRQVGGCSQRCEVVGFAGRISETGVDFKIKGGAGQRHVDVASHGGDCIEFSWR